MKRLPSVPALIIQTAKELGLSYCLEPEYGYVGYVCVNSGKRMYFRNHTFDINTYGAVKIAKDKAYTCFFLSRAGIFTPEGKTFFSKKHNALLSKKRTIDDGYLYACSLGFPVIIKPNNASMGSLVFRAETRAQYYDIARIIFSHHPVMLVERFYTGQDYRILIFDKKIYAVYARKPLFVIGNGIYTIKALIKKKQIEVKVKKGLKKMPKYLSNKQILKKLMREGISLTDIVPAGAMVTLLDSANLSTGGDALDVTDVIHPSFVSIALKVSEVLNLRIAGIDILAQDITKQAHTQRYIVLEVNGNPGMENFIRIGKKQYKRIHTLVKDILNSYG